MLEDVSCLNDTVLTTEYNIYDPKGEGEFENKFIERESINKSIEGLSIVI